MSKLSSVECLAMSGWDYKCEWNSCETSRTLEQNILGKERKGERKREKENEIIERKNEKVRREFLSKKRAKGLLKEWNESRVADI